MPVSLEHSFGRLTPRARFILKLAPVPVLYGLCIAYLIHAGERDEFSVLMAVDLRALAFAILASVLANFILRALRHRLLLNAIGVPVGFGRLIDNRALLLFIKAFVPFFLGDPGAYYVVGRRLGLNNGQSISLWGLDKLLALLGLLPLGMGLLGYGNPPLQWTLIALTMLSTCLALCLIKMPGAVKQGQGEPEKWKLIHQLKGALAAIAGMRVPARVSLMALVYIDEFLRFAVLVAFFAPVLGGVFFDKLLLLHVVGALPLSFAGLGTREGAALLIFASDGPASTIFASALAVTLIMRLLPASVGAVSLFRASLGSKVLCRNGTAAAAKNDCHEKD